MVEMLMPEKHGFYVAFELRPQEDREASEKAGHPVFIDIEIATITMPGGSLVVDKVVTPELLREWEFGGRNKPASPLALQSYKAWKANEEVPLDGMDLKNWPGVTPSQLKMCQGANIRTVEDLAGIHQDGIRRLGMGGVSLKDKAIAYLRQSGTNKVSEEVASLKLKLEALTELVERKDREIDELLDDTPKKRVRPAKAA